MPVGPIGMAAIGTGLNMFSNMFTADQNQRREREQQEYFMSMQRQSDMEMSRYNMERQLELWEKTGYGPTVEQMKKAGLNPALLYSKGGGGGTTAANTVAGSAPKASGRYMDTPNMGMGMELALLKAQKENIEADTKLKETDANKKAGVDTEAAQAGIRLTEALTNNEIVKKEINEQVREQQFIETHIKTMTMNNVVAQAKYQTEQMWEVLQGQVTQNKINMATAQEQIEIIKQQKINLVVQKAVMEAGITKTQAEINAMTEGIMQNWEKIHQGWRDVNRNDREQMLNVVGGKGGAGNFWDYGGIIFKKNPEQVAKQLDEIMKTGTIKQ